MIDESIKHCYMCGEKFDTTFGGSVFYCPECMRVGRRIITNAIDSVYDDIPMEEFEPSEEEVREFLNEIIMEG